MCLSTAYETSETGAVLAENVSYVTLEDGVITMTDIMGATTKIKGALRSTDLTRGVIIILPE